MRRIALAVPIFVASVSIASAATYWSAISTGCVPDAASIQGNRYKPSSDSAIRHRATNLNRIVLVCGVAPNSAGVAPEVLTMTYRDSTASGTKAYVKSQLFSVTRAAGVRSLIVTVSSNSSPAATLTKLQSAPFVHSLDFNSNFYFVRIEIDRAASNQTVSAVGVALEEAD